MTHHKGSPTFHVLDRAESEALLGRHNVGRIAYSFRDRVDIEPVHYVFEDGHIYGRTQFGTKVEVMAHHPWVAFEVDEVDALFEWRSVVVHGRIVFPDPIGPPDEAAQYARGMEVFRTLVPAAFTDADPTPARDIVFVLHINDMSGRAATDGRSEAMIHQ